MFVATLDQREKTKVSDFHFFRKDVFFPDEEENRILDLHSSTDQPKRTRTRKLCTSSALEVQRSDLEIGSHLKCQNLHLFSANKTNMCAAG